MKSFLPDKVYEILKWAVILALPAIAEFIAWLFPAYDIPNGDLIAETIRRIALLIGILIGVSAVQYGANASKQSAMIADFQPQQQTTFNTSMINDIEGEVENVEEISDSDECADNVE